MNDVLQQLLDKANAKPSRKRPSHMEDRLQMACRYWFDAQYPKLKLLLHHSPNEGHIRHDEGNGAKRKAMGMRAGFPDFIFLFPSKSYAYLALELKSAKGRQTEHQKEYQQVMERNGGKYVIVRSLEEFMDAVNAYLKD